MILIGIAKEKFLSEYYKEPIKNNWDLNELEYIFNMLPEACQNALIIEFFDSIEYNKNSSLWDYCFFDCYWDKGLREYKQATIQAIKKANDIYNERFK